MASTAAAMDSAMDGAESAAPRESNVIYEGDSVVCETSDGRVFLQLVKKNETIRIGKKLTSLKPVVGATYGSIFEEKNKHLVLVDGGLFPDPVAPETGEFEVPDADNRHFADTNSAQNLSAQEIEALRDSGMSGQAIIQKLVENSDTWDAKTEFSKQKYLKKKQQKYMPRVRFLKSTAESLCRTYRCKNPSKILSLREDTLGQMLVYGNIYAQAQVLVVDTCMGLVTGAIVERQNGLGRVLAAYDGQQLAADLLRRFNFDRSTMASVHSFPLTWVDNLASEQVDPNEAAATARLSEEECRRLEQERMEQYTPSEREAYLKKKAKRAADKLPRQSAEVVRGWLRAQSDSLVIATHFDPNVMLRTLLPWLKCSRPFVVYCEYLEPLVVAFRWLQDLPSVVDVQLSETFTRPHQVLPGRTHPDMKMNAYSGYLLTGIKVAEIVSKMSTESLQNEKDDDTAEPESKRAKTTDK